MFNRIKDFNLGEWTQVLSIIIAAVIGGATVFIAWQANDISHKQTEFIAQQTEILKNQTSLQEQGIRFEQERHKSDVYRDNRDIMNALFDKITYIDETLVAINKKVANGEKIQSLDNLDRYVNEFENIGNLYCDGNVRMTDLRFVLSSTLKHVCGNSQIYNRYQNTKSGLSGLCEGVFPGSSVMARFVNVNKCPILKK